MRGEGIGLDVRGVSGEESCGEPGGDRAEKEPEKIFTIRPL